MKFSISSVAAAATGLVLAMSVGSASAVPTFTIDLSAITGGPSNTYVGDKFVGSSSELLTTAAGGHTGSGWLQLSALDRLGTAQVGFGNLGLFGLFVTFQLADTYRAGTGTGINTPNSINDLSLLNFQVWADPSKDNVFTQASASGTGTLASYTGGVDDIFLGFGSLISGVSGFNEGGGAHLNSMETFGLCSGDGTALIGSTAVANANCATGQGKGLFVDPNPFYTIAFDEFNNTAQGIARNGNLTSINEATGAIDFNRIPEPGSIALLGIALAGLGVSVRRGKKTLL